MHSIRFKITALTVAAILVSIVCIFVAGYLTLRGENDRQSAQTMNMTVQNAQMALEKYTEGVEQSVEMAANITAETLDSTVLVECGVTSLTVENRSAQQTQRLDLYLQSYLDELQKTFHSLASHTQGVVTYYFCISPDISLDRHGFFYSKVGKTGFEEQTPLDARELDRRDTAHTVWYYQPIERGRPSWVGPYTAHFLDEMWTCSYVVPIYKAGAFIGVLGMDIPLATLTDQIQSIRIFRTGFAVLTTSEGTILYHPNMPLGTKLSQALDGDIATLLKTQSASEDMIRYTTHGQTRQLSFVTMSNGMKLTLVAPVTQVNESWTRLRNIVIGIGAAIILVFSLFLMVTMRHLTHPLQRLTDASRRLAAGDYTAELDKPGRDEVGTLTQAFTAMRDQQKRSFEELRRQVEIDGLTGLPNLRHFFRLAEAERQTMLEEGRQPAVVYYNLSGMKIINRRYGLEEGDRLICAVADVLARRYEGHSVCRVGQDRYAVLTEEAGLEDTIREVFRDCETVNGGRTLPLRAGIYLDSLEQVSINLACDRAKAAGEQVKTAGQSDFLYFDTDMLKKTESTRYVVENLDRALEEGWIRVYYQPIVRAANGRVCDEEALARWIDPERGFMSPADFIPALEDSRLIYKLDLYVVESILKKMKRQADAGLYVVPTSVNLSRADFDSCDIVEEICRRVDAAGIPRFKMTIEITESMVGTDFDFITAQVDRFRQQGFQVWMDDFGSGYSSLDVLQRVHFDLIKFDMRFMDCFEDGMEGRIILTELVKMAIGLGIETVCEGVETQAQMEFLREIGCTKLQGFYYCKPIPPEEIIVRNEKGIQIGFENPAETEYYTTIGGINLYDIAVLSPEGEEDLNRYFDTLPMAIMEVSGSIMRYIRGNKSYRDFMQRVFGLPVSGKELDYTNMPQGPGVSFLGAVMRCSKDGNRALVDEQVDEKTTIHALLRRVGVNPVTGTVAVAVAVLAVVEDDGQSEANFASIAKALSSDYVNLYYVNIQNEQFVEYTSATGGSLAVERRGEDFFGASAKDARHFIFKDDQDYFIRVFTKENVLREMDEHGAFTLTYRLVEHGAPVYVSMKAVRIPMDPAHIIIGVSNVDAQIRQKEEVARLETEKATYSRISALNRDCICIYAVDPVTYRYTEFSVAQSYAGLGLAKAGENFFEQSRRYGAKLVYEEDQEKFRTMLTPEKIREDIEKSGIFSLQYRILLGGEPKFVNLKASMVEEQDGPQLIIGVNDVDEQVRREQDYEQRLASARSRANLDALTGVKTKPAYDTLAENLTRQIEDGQALKCAIVLCRAQDLEQVVAEQGEEAGNQFIRSACYLICNAFKHSPVFRMDQTLFAAVVQGGDYENIDALMADLEQAVANRQGPGSVAVGMARREDGESVETVMQRTNASFT